MTKSLDPFRFLLIAVSGRMNQHQRELIDYLRREWLYGTLGLFSGYRVSYVPSSSAVAPV